LLIYLIIYPKGRGIKGDRFLSNLMQFLLDKNQQNLNYRVRRERKIKNAD